MNKSIEIELIDEALKTKQYYKQFISISATESKLSDLKFEECKFDKGSWFRKCALINVSFTGSVLNGNFVDNDFIDCDFSHIGFKGGLQEYGFKFCSFTNCILNMCQFKGVYFINCQFVNCRFELSTISNSIVRCCDFNNDEKALFWKIENCDIRPKSYYK